MKERSKRRMEEGELRLLKKTLVIAAATSALLFLTITLFFDESAYLAIAYAVVAMLVASVFIAAFSELALPEVWHRRGITLLYGLIF